MLQGSGKTSTAVQIGNIGGKKDDRCRRNTNVTMHVPSHEAWQDMKQMEVKLPGREYTDVEHILCNDCGTARIVRIQY